MKKLFYFFAAMLVAICGYAQEVTLVVSGSAKTEEDATLIALRSAIEQSFGTFVSANTTILNDKLVQDEIVSVSTGNIKEYQKLAVAPLGNGQIMVTLNATVSINKLISYAKNKGSRAEFAGSTFAMEVKMTKLQAESADKAYRLMIKQLNLLSKDMFDFKIELGTPTLKNGKYVIPTFVGAYSSVRTHNFAQVFINTVKSLTIPQSQISKFQQAGIDPANMSFLFESFSSGYGLTMGFAGKGEKFYIPIPHKTLYEYNKQIAELLKESLWDYSVAAIGTYDKGRYIANDRNDWYLFDNNTREKTILDERYVKGMLSASMTRAHDNSILASALLLEEKKTPMNFTKEQKKMIKKGTYNGPMYNITYGEGHLINGSCFKSYVSAEEMNSFQGFQIKSKK